MAKFEIAEQITGKIEGTYSNDPDDPGGETACGISRVNHPQAKIWPILDRHQVKEQALLDADFVLLVSDFYKENFWDCYRLDEVRSQRIANEIYDSGVNLGQVRVARWVQENLNVLNRWGKAWPDIIEDGQMGPATVNVLNYAVGKGEEEAIMKLLNADQCVYYKSRAQKNPIKEKFLHGWLAHRVTV